MSANPPGSEIRSGIGARLRAGREKMGLTLLQVAEKMHVDAKVLESLEAERFDWLGAPVYAKGHLRHYSELIGENTSELLDMYSAATKPIAPDLTQIAQADKRRSDPRKLVVPSLVVLIAFALVGMVWWILQGMQVGPPPTPHTVSETFSTEPPTAVESPPAPKAKPVEAQVVAPTQAPTAAAAQAPARAAPAPAPPAIATRTPAVAAAPVMSVARLTAPRRGSPGPVAPAVSGAATPDSNVTPAGVSNGQTINVTLKFASDSWVEVYDAKGAKLFYDIGAASSSHKLTGTPPLRVTFGNAPGVNIEVNGKRARVPANAVENDTAQFTINRSGRLVRVSAPGDGG